MKKFAFEGLTVYQVSLDVASSIYPIFSKMSYNLQRSIGNNLVRATLSISCNIAEGSGRRSNREKKQSFVVSQGSVSECIPIITVLYRANVISKSEFENLYAQFLALSKMLTALIVRFRPN